MSRKKYVRPNMENEVRHVIAQLVEQHATTSSIPHIPLQSKQNLKQDIMNTVEQFRDICCSGMKLMIDDLASTLPSKEKDELAHEFRHFVLSLETEPKRKKFYKLIADGKTKKEALGLTTFFMSSLFQSAVGFFDQQKYQEAIVSFIALTWLDETNYVYPLFLGFSYFREQKYYEALAAYMTSAPNAPDMSPLLYMAQCFLSLGQLDQAQLCAEAGLKEEKLSEHPNREILSLFETILISTKVSV